MLQSIMGACDGSSVLHQFSLHKNTLAWMLDAKDNLSHGVILIMGCGNICKLIFREFVPLLGKSVRLGRQWHSLQMCFHTEA
jgi:hypothetical protein